MYWIEETGICFLKMSKFLSAPPANTLKFSLGKKVDHHDSVLQSQATLLQLIYPEACPQLLLAIPDATQHPHGTIGPI